MITKIISGGQTGADMGGLLAGRQLGLETGGAAPKGFWTERGAQKDLLTSFGLYDSGRGYSNRTEENVEKSDGTVIFGDPSSPGSRLTLQMCFVHKKTYFVVPYSWPVVWAEHRQGIEDCRRWLKENRISVLNVAGNRESRNPGIENFVASFLIAVLNSPSE